jgi:hypothetical protein
MEPTFGDKLTQLSFYCNIQGSIYVLIIFKKKFITSVLFFCLLWGSLVVRFGDDVAKGSPMQESLSSGSRVDALLRASELDINE